jgi:hypothetical protein
MSSGLGAHAPVLHRGHEGGMVALGLVGIGVGKGQQGPVKRVTLAEVPANEHRIAGPGVGQCPGPAAERGVVGQGRIVPDLDMAAAAQAVALSPLLRPATTLVTRRLMSHSHGPESVSSKSLMPKTRLRSGVA